MKIITSTNFEFSDARNFAYPTGKSQTVPNQVLTPAEMLQRFTRGQDLNVSAFQPYYSSIELPQIERMDIHERHEYMEENSEKIAALRAEQSETEEKNRKTREKAAYKAELEAEAKANSVEEAGGTPKTPTA